jgi:hypothetical protein
MKKEKTDYYKQEEIDNAVFKFLRHGEKPPEEMGKTNKNIFELNQDKIIPRNPKENQNTGVFGVFLRRALKTFRSF